MMLDIPGYKIVRTLGKGGMATVYLAVQEIFEREVALKVMAKELANNPDFGQRFFREARIVSKLSHPNIVTVYDVGVHDGLYYLSMEYIDGQDLKLARKRLNILQKIQVVQDIARALQFAGQKGYVHRDIKPDNIMLYAKDNRAVLMDFGIARASEADISVTQAGTAIGTPHYMSPEQAKGQAVDIRSDLYSLGVVFYLLLTGHVPYDGDSAVAIGIKHITQPLPQLPEGVAAAQPILNRLMAKLPAERYQAPEELVTALEALKAIPLEIVEGVPVAATTTSKPLSGEVEAVEHVYLQPGVSASDATQVSGSPLGIDEPTFTLTSEAVIAGDKTWDISWPWVVGVLAVALAAGGSVVYLQKHKQEGRPFDRLAQAESATSKPQNLAVTEAARSLQDRINQKRRLLDVDPTQLVPLVQLYRQLEQIKPNDKAIAQALSELARQQVKKIGVQINAADFDAAAVGLNAMGVLFPEYVGDDLLAQEVRFKRREQIEQLLVEADKSRKRGAVNGADALTARQKYEAILAVDPDIEPARIGLAAFTKSTLASQTTARSPNELPATTAERLDLAATYVQQGKLYLPAGDCAHKLYQLVLTQEPGNEVARKGMQVLPVELEKRNKRWLGDNLYAEARAQTQAALKANPGDKRILVAQQQLDAAIVERNKVLLPQVVELRVAGYPNPPIDDPQPSVISVSKNIFVHFRLAGQQVRPLQLMLYQGARRQRLVNVPIEVTGDLVNLKIDPPPEGFGRGSYVMDIVAAAQIVESIKFVVE